MTAAVLAKGTTVIDNAAREPEIVDLCRMLVAMGAQIDGIGTSTLEITGVERAAPDRRHDAVADRIVAGTWAMAAVATRGDVDGARRRRRPPRDRAGQAGARRRRRRGAWPTASGCRSTTGPRASTSSRCRTRAWPTDLQPQAIALLSVADGTAMITENLFEARFMFCDEIARMGADVRTDGHHAVVRGKERLSGAPVRATDIRAGVGLVHRRPGRRRRHRGRRDPPHRPRLRALRGAAARARCRRAAGRGRPSARVARAPGRRPG